MRILFISLYEDVSSIGIRYLSSYLKSKGTHVNILHMPATSNDTHYAPLIDSQKSVSLLINKIIELKPNMIGIGLMTNYFKRAAALALEIKKNCSAPIVFGGIHPTICPEECLKYSDIVCMGEAEETLLELSNINEYPADLSIVKGIAFKKNGGIIKNELRPLEENLDKYPFPDYSFEGEFIIFNNKIKSLNKENIVGFLNKYPFGNLSYRIMSSRGCPFSCTYCCNFTLKQMWEGKGKYVRNRSVENVINEMVEIKNRLPVRSFRIMDDSFLFNTLEWFKEFNKEYKAKVGLVFSCLSNPLNVSYDKLKLLVDCGLRHIQIGLQSGSDKINYDIYERKIKRGAFLKSIDILGSLNPIPKLTIDVILDNPFETKMDRIQTIDLLKNIKIPFDIGPFALTYYPKTKLYDKAEKEGIINNSVREKIYTKSYTKLKKDPLNAQILLLNRRNISPALVEYSLKNKFLSFISYMAIEFLIKIKNKIKANRNSVP